MLLTFDRIVLNERRWSNFSGILTEILPVKGDNVKRVDEEGYRSRPALVQRRRRQDRRGYRHRHCHRRHRRRASGSRCRSGGRRCLRRRSRRHRARQAHQPRARPATADQGRLRNADQINILHQQMPSTAGFQEPGRFFARRCWWIIAENGYRTPDRFRGPGDHYVAAMKGAVLTIAPDAGVVDISHEIPAHDIRKGVVRTALLLSRFPVRNDLCRRCRPWRRLR